MSKFLKDCSGSECKDCYWTVTRMLVIRPHKIRRNVIEFSQPDACQCSEGSGILAENLDMDDNITKSTPYVCLRVNIKNLINIYFNNNFTIVQ